AAMRERGSGTLVGIASVAAIRGLPGHGAYCASKAAVVAYCESLRGELRGSGVAVVTLLPGYVDTPLTRQNRYGMPFLLSAAALRRGGGGDVAAGLCGRATDASEPLWDALPAECGCVCRPGFSGHPGTGQLPRDSLADGRGGQTAASPAQPAV